MQHRRLPFARSPLAAAAICAVLAAIAQPALAAEPVRTSALAASMAADHAAYLAKVAAAGPLLIERRDEPTLATVAQAIDKINTAFTEYKKTNDQRLEELKKGNATGDLDAKLGKLEKDLDQLSEQKSRLEKLETRLSRPGAGAGQRQEGESLEAAEYRSAFIDWMRAPTDHDRQQRATAAAKALEAKAGSGDRERRAAQTVTGSGSAGGFALPEQIEQTIGRLSVDISPMRQICTVRSVGSPDYKELIDVGGAGFEWVGETDTRNGTNTPDLQEIAPTFGMASAKPRASEESLDDLFFDVEGWLVSSASEALAYGEGAAFVAGNGTKKPTGFLAGPAPLATNDAGRAFGTLQYVAGGQAGALPSTLDVFYDLIYSVRARYRANARWTAAKLTLAGMRKYKDSTGQYMWVPSVQAGMPDMFMGFPVTELEDMPAVAANAFPVAFGDFKEGYLIADRVGTRITRDEITTPGFVNFYVRKRVGGRLRNTQAIKLLKISTT